MTGNWKKIEHAIGAFSFYWRYQCCMWQFSVFWLIIKNSSSSVCACVWLEKQEILDHTVQIKNKYRIFFLISNWKTTRAHNTKNPLRNMIVQFLMFFNPNTTTTTENRTQRTKIIINGNEIKILCDFILIIIYIYMFFIYFLCCSLLLCLWMQLSLLEWIALTHTLFLRYSLYDMHYIFYFCVIRRIKFQPDSNFILKREREKRSIFDIGEKIDCGYKGGWNRI